MLRIVLVLRNRTPREKGPFWHHGDNVVNLSQGYLLHHYVWLSQSLLMLQMLVRKWGSVTVVTTYCTCGPYTGYKIICVNTSRLMYLSDMAMSSATKWFDIPSATSKCVPKCAQTTVFHYLIDKYFLCVDSEQNRAIPFYLDVKVLHSRQLRQLRKSLFSI